MSRDAAEYFQMDKWKIMTMAKEYLIGKDIKVLCVKASSFPEGVLAAHQKLHSLFSAAERTFYGISYAGENGKIVYRAAVEQKQEGEAESLHLDTFVIRKGVYITKFQKDWRRDETVVGKTFRELLSDPRIDKNGYCVEKYLNETDMLCMVPLDPMYSRSEPEKNTPGTGLM